MLFCNPIPPTKKTHRRNLAHALQNELLDEPSLLSRLLHQPHKFGLFSRELRAFPFPLPLTSAPMLDWLANQKNQQHQSTPQTRQQSPRTPAGRRLPQPAPMHRQMNQNQSDQTISQPSMNIPPIVPPQPHCTEPFASTRPRWQPPCQQQTRSRHSTKNPPQHQIENLTGQKLPPGKLPACLA